MWKRWLALILVLTPVFSFPQNPSASLEGNVVDRVTSASAVSSPADNSIGLSIG